MTDRVLLPRGHTGESDRRGRLSPRGRLLVGAVGLIAAGSALLFGLNRVSSAGQPPDLQILAARAEGGGEDTAMAGMERPSAPTAPFTTPAAGLASEASARDEALTSASAFTAPAAPLTPATTADFRVISLEQALTEVTGGLSSIEGMTVTRIEVGPGASVPYALPDAPVVRFVYTAPDGGLLLLDQQHLPDTANLGRVGMAPGDTLISTAENGVTVAMWLANRNLRLSLAGRLSQDSIRQLLTRLR